MFNLIKKLTILVLVIYLPGCSNSNRRTHHDLPSGTIQVSSGQAIQIGSFTNELGFSDPTKIKSNIKYLTPISTLVKQALREELSASGYQIKKSDIKISGKIHRIWGQNKVTFTIEDTLTKEVLLEKLFLSEISSGLLSDKLSHKSNLNVLMNKFLQDPEVIDIFEEYNEPAVKASLRALGETGETGEAGEAGALIPAPVTLTLNDEFRDKKRVALVIGNSNYQIGILKNPKNDATDVAQALKKLGFSVILEIDANQKSMDNAILRFGRELANGGVGLFYYAGHGVQVNGSNYLIPIAANINEERDVKYRAVNLGQVLDEMRDVQTGLNIVIIDACRDNPLPKSARSSTRGLARISSPSGTIIMYATSPGSVASDGDGRNGLFSKHLLNFISSPNNSIELVMKKVSKNVQLESGNKQTPWMESSFTGDFYFLTQDNNSSFEDNIGSENNISPESQLSTEPSKPLENSVSDAGIIGPENNLGSENDKPSTSKVIDEYTILKNRAINESTLVSEDTLDSEAYTVPENTAIKENIIPPESNVIPENNNTSENSAPPFH